MKFIMLAFALFYSNSFASIELPVFDYTEFKCLEDNIYHEARGEGNAGMIAVAIITMNRTIKQSKSICEVVYSPNQFSWTSEKISARGTRAASRLVSLQTFFGGQYAGHGEGKQWQLAMEKLKQSTFYHNRTVRPTWSKKMKRVAVIGNHIFYKG
jgi:spore germination cell wall hydrolase CwlJ-like protein